MKMIAVACDHGAYALKEAVKAHLAEKGYEVKDFGTYSAESCDYPDYAYKLGMGIINSEVDFGIAICGTGIGISIVLNKMKGVYCAKCDSADDAVQTRVDNNTNVIAFGEKMGLNNAITCVETFISTEYSFLEKHNRRINKMKQIEEGVYRG